jgi:hypothetical protein
VSEGPSGGLSVNLFCCGEWVDAGETFRCGARFNSTPFGMELVEPSTVDSADYACGKRLPDDGWRSVPATGKYTPSQIVAKFTGQGTKTKKHWWNR